MGCTGGVWWRGAGAGAGFGEKAWQTHEHIESSVVAPMLKDSHRSISIARRNNGPKHVIQPLTKDGG